MAVGVSPVGEKSAWTVDVACVRAGEVVFVEEDSALADGAAETAGVADAMSADAAALAAGAVATGEVVTGGDAAFEFEAAVASAS